MRCGDVMVSTSKIAHVRQVLFADANVLSVITHFSGFWGHISQGSGVIHNGDDTGFTKIFLLNPNSHQFEYHSENVWLEHANV
jgi:hypothetical protein